MSSYNFLGFVCILLLSLLLSEINGSSSNLDSIEAFANGTLDLSTGEQHKRNHSGSLNIERVAWESQHSGFSPKKDESRLVHYAMLKDEGEFFGTFATLNVWGLPYIGDKQSSSMRMLLASGLDGPLNTHNVIGAGWHVFPEIYGDNDTHLMAYWSADGFQSTGCYNLLCKGFVPYNPSPYQLGSKIRPLSTYDGDQYEISLAIFKDKLTGHWVLRGGRDGSTRIGHWPKSLFTNLAENASFVEFGGMVSYHAHDTTPPMGSGHFPADGMKRAAYLDGLFVIRKSGYATFPDLGAVQDRPDCYGAVSDPPFFVGGPGYCSD